MLSNYLTDIHHIDRFALLDFVINVLCDDRSSIGADKVLSRVGTVIICPDRVGVRIELGKANSQQKFIITLELVEGNL